MLMLAATSQVVNFQPHNGISLNVVTDLQSPVEQVLLKTFAMDIAQNYSGNCDRIRAASKIHQLGLSPNEIERLGAGHPIIMNHSRLARIHARFLSSSGGTYRDEPMQGQEGQFWVVNRQYSSLPYDSSSVAQKTKSIEDVALMRKISGNEMSDLVAQSRSGSIWFAYNFQGRTCMVIISFSNGIVPDPLVTYPSN
jgi:hypothetical protein